MRSVRLKQVTKIHSGLKTLDRVDLTIPSGEFFALLGPSGCGKTTLLRLIAGLDQPDEGAIFIGQNEVTHLPVNQRKVNIVFQNYALFPHLTVFDNIAYSLKLQKISRASINNRVLKIVEAFHLQAQIFKKPDELSGGQQQRVALARGIINEPDVLLLDEPLAALDFKLREKMLVELIELQDILDTTFIYVTHDQFEALTVADHMAIFSPKGEVEQIGTPEEIYEFPASTFVAKFVGTTNLLLGTLNFDHQPPHVQVPHLGRFEIERSHRKGWMCGGMSVRISLRPEKIFIFKDRNKTRFSNRIEGIVSQIVYYGRSTQYTVIVNDHLKMIVFKQNEEHLDQENIDYGDQVYLYFQKESILLLEN